MNNSNQTNRAWGLFHVLSEPSENVKVKELIVDPYSSLSLQKHAFRNEAWFVAKGSGKLKSEGQIIDLDLFNQVRIPPNTWHQLINHTAEPLHIIEIQYGEKCIEEDIERK